MKSGWLIFFSEEEKGEYLKIFEGCHIILSIIGLHYWIVW